MISDNEALGTEVNGGGLIIHANNGSTVEADGLRVINNFADDDGGGVLISNSASLVTLRNSTISGNEASFNNSLEAAGGLLLRTLAGGNTFIENSTISDNRTITGPDQTKQNAKGGGLYIVNEANTTTTIRNTTISGNLAEGSGGGIKIGEYIAGGHVNILHSTITNNRADSDGDMIGTGGGIHRGTSATTVTLDHTIVAGNFRGPESNQTSDDIVGTVTATWSLIGNNAGSNLAEAPIGAPDANGNLVGGSINGAMDPLLGPLVYNGGPVFLDGSRMLTHALLPTSPALDAGDPDFDPLDPDGDPMTDDALPFDQRGNPWQRVVGMDQIDIGAFEWQTNPLPGDYNFNGIVDAADYTTWRDTFGQLVDPFSAADGSGNGVIDLVDYDIWKGEFGEVIADGSGNGATDIADYLLWVSTQGSTADLRADYNDDGIVDDADFDIWFDTFGSTLEIAQFGLLSDWFAPGAPPAVVGVALSLSGVQGMDFAGKVGSGEQLRSVPLIAANTLNITFSRDVVVAYTDLQIVNLDGASPTIFDFSYDALSQTATWIFTSSLADGRYLLRLSDSVETSAGHALDGEFTNPWSLSATGTSVFPSGDGTAGGEFRFRFTVLAGDTDHDNVDGTADYQNWQPYEPGMILVSITTDEMDGNLTFGDVSLREAVDHANNAGEPTTIELPAGRYTLTLTGTESPGTALNDLDVSGNVTILGAGAGVSVVTPAWAGAQENRVFEASGAAARLRLERVTVAGKTIGGSAAALVQNQAELEIVDSALVNNIVQGTGVAVRSLGSDVTVLRSVFTNNQGVDGVAIDSLVQGANAGSLTIGESIFALNVDWYHSYGTTPNVKAASSVAKTNLGNNLYDFAGGGFFNVVSGAGDHLGTPHYVVTTVADTFDHTDNVESLSIREAVDLANQASGTQEIWIPAWKFTLTRDRGSMTSDVDTAWGDLDISDSLIIRGVQNRTSIAWKAGIVDEVFDLLGDYNDDGQADAGNVSAADYTIWRDQNGSSGDYEQFSADGDDDGDVDQDDYDVWTENYGHTLELFDVLS